MADWIKDANARMDYVFDWSAWLAGDTITGTPVVTVDPGLNLDLQTNDTTTVTVWLSGGTVGQVYKVSCRITTAAGRTDERTALIQVTDR